jgi:GNAT superfamily N-acetyltransferase
MSSETVNSPSVLIREFSSHDSVQALTAMLHRAYAPLAHSGMNFTAVDQTVEVTLRRIADGQCFVAVDSGAIVGTVTVSGPFDPTVALWALQTPWYYRADTAHFHQFAVEPDRQGQGLGNRLVARCERWAREQDYVHMALDTALPAQQLRARYAKLGYRDEGEVHWEGKTYRSAIMVKTLNADALLDKEDGS